MSTKPSHQFNISELEKVIRSRIRGVIPQKTQEDISAVVSNVQPSKITKLIKEALVVIPRSFVMKTEFLSQFTKENHAKLYKSYADSFNIISAKLDSLSRTDAENPNNSEFRRLKLDEQHNLNGVKLHELYFTNVSDLGSEIRVDSIPYMRLAAGWGTFEAWQFDFRACGMAATEGWAVLYWEPFKQKYLNTFIEKHTENVAVMGIPVLVIDTWHHAWFKDHPGDKMNYLNAMMKEINWAVVEARMAIAEKSDLHKLYMIEPASNIPVESQVKMAASNEPPIGKDQVGTTIKVG